jgi:hypothetical protein
MIDSLTLQCDWCKKKTSFVTSGLDYKTNNMHVSCNCDSENNSQYPFQKLFWLVARVNDYWNWIHDKVEFVAPCSIYIPKSKPIFDPYDAIHIHDLSFRFKRSFRGENLDQVYQIVLMGNKPMREIKNAIVIPIPSYPALLLGHEFHETIEGIDRVDPMTIVFLESLNSLNQEFAQILGFSTGFCVCNCKATKSLESHDNLYKFQ